MAANMVAFPKFDGEAINVFWTSNIAVGLKAQRMLIDAAQATVVRQFDLAREVVRSIEGAALNLDVNKKPEAYVEDVKSAAERAKSIVRIEVNNGQKVQKDIADLVSNQIVANIAEMKTRAA